MPHVPRHLGIELSVFAVCFTFVVSACVADQTVVGRNVPAAQRVPLESIDHSLWNALLTKYVDRRGYVDYTAWKASGADQKALDDYLATLSSARIANSASREAAMAFWINAYNAVTVKGILREYPTTSIRNHTAKFFGYNIWKDLRLPVDGRSYSLEDMEHNVLRKKGEPRIHFAIVCASVGCPPLRSEAYTAGQLDAQLTANAKAFFADRSKFSYDANRRTIQVSPILSWFAEDFGTNDAQRLQAIAPYLPDAASQQLAKSGSASISYLDYDWSLNDQAKLRTPSTR